MNIFELTRILNEMQSKVEQTKNTLDVYDEVEDDQVEKDKNLTKVNNYLTAEIKDSQNEEVFYRRKFFEKLNRCFNNNIPDVAIFKDILSEMNLDEIKLLSSEQSTFDLTNVNSESDFFNLQSRSEGWQRLCRYTRYGIGAFEVIFALATNGKMIGGKRKTNDGMKGDVEVGGKICEIKTVGGAISYNGGTIEDYMRRFHYLIFFDKNGNCQVYSPFKDNDEFNINDLHDYFDISGGKNTADERTNRSKIKGILNRTHVQ